MEGSPGFAPNNHVLAAVLQAELERLRPYCIRTRLVRDQILVEQGQVIEHVFFLEGGVVALIADPGAGQPGIQVAMIGREGLTGGLALLDSASVAYSSALVLVPGPALRVPLSELRLRMNESPLLRDACLRYLRALTRQIMETAACNARHSLSQRCVRWLLQMHDRIDGDDLPVTHETLSAMVGVHRSGVAAAISALQEAKLIRCGRGRIKVLDRAGLENAALGGRLHGGAVPAPVGGVGAPRRVATGSNA